MCCHPGHADRLKPVAQQLPVDRVEQRLEAGVDDIRAHADGGPAPPPAIFAVDDHARDRLGATLGDAHLEVDQLHVVDTGLVRAKILTQRLGERVDRAAVRAMGIEAFGHRKLLFVADLHHHHRFRQAHHLVAPVLAPLDRDLVALDLEELRQGAQHPQRQQLETRLRAVIGIAVILARLDLVEDLAEPRVALLDLDPGLGQAAAQVRLPGLVRHRHEAGIAHQPRIDVLVGGRVFEDRAGVQPGLVGEGAGTDVGRAAQRHAVEDIVKLARDLGKRDRLRLGHADIISRAVGFLEQQRRDQGDQVGVAAALAEAIERALHLARAGIDRGEAARHRIAGIVMAMDRQPVAGDARFDHRAGDIVDLARQRAAVGVAQHHPARAGVVGGERRVERIGRIRLVAVEEMLGVKQRFLALCDDVFDRGADIFEVFVKSDAQRRGDVEIVGLADEADGGGMGVHHLRQHVVVGRRAPDPLGHAESGEGGAGLGAGLEKVAVGGVRAGPATLDVVDAQIVQRLGDGDLLRHRKLHTLGLLAVAQGGVVDVEAFSHWTGLSLEIRCRQPPPGPLAARFAPDPPPRARTSVLLKPPAITAPPAWPGRSPAQSQRCSYPCLLGSSHPLRKDDHGSRPREPSLSTAAPAAAHSSAYQSRH